MRYLATLLFALLAWTWTIPASANVSTNVQAKDYRLANGLKLLVVEDNRAPVVAVQIWYKVGSAHETNGISGLSHLLEHLMFDGTKKYPSDSLTRIVAENGGKQNAATSQDFTFYFEQMSADKLPLAFDLEADRMQNLNITQKEFDKEIKVVREERRMRTNDNPQALTQERFNANAHLASPYHHPVVGWMNDLNNLKLSDAQKWYKTWYAPNNATIVVVGDVQPNNVYKLAKKYFGKIKPSQSIPTLKPQHEPPPLGTRTVNVNTPAKVPFILMGYNVPSIKTAKQEWVPYALAVASGVLGGSASSRLQRNLVRGKEIASEADADYQPYTLFSSLFVISGTPAPGHTTKELRKAFNAAIKKLQTSLVTKEELQRIKAQVIADKIYSQDSMVYTGIQLGNLVSIGLPWQTINKDITQLQQVTPQQIQEVARKYLVPSRLTIAVLTPQTISKQKDVQNNKEEQHG